ncbi:plasmid maintenance system antidote protein VapI [Phyllobacterium sp. P30BS-XVII]|nr:plasmid maintenance system antidote protein VapI [Phyllobacterium sp. P30BS-XVII]
MNMQTSYDLKTESRNKQAEIDKIVALDSMTHQAA